MSLGEMARECRSDRQLTMPRYFENHQSELMNEYPICQMIVKRILMVEVPQNRPQPGQLMEMMRNNEKQRLVEPAEIVRKKAAAMEFDIRKHQQAPIEEQLNHFLHTCTAYNSLGLYGCTVELFERLRSRGEGSQASIGTEKRSSRPSRKQNNRSKSISTVTDQASLQSPLQLTCAKSSFFIEVGIGFLGFGCYEEAMEILTEGSQFISELIQVYRLTAPSREEGSTQRRLHANEAQTNETQTNETRPNETQTNETRPNETRPNETQPNEAQTNEPRPKQTTADRSGQRNQRLYSEESASSQELSRLRSLEAKVKYLSLLAHFMQINKCDRHQKSKLAESCSKLIQELRDALTISADARLTAETARNPKHLLYHLQSFRLEMMVYKDTNIKTSLHITQQISMQVTNLQALLAKGEQLPAASQAIALDACQQLLSLALSSGPVHKEAQKDMLALVT